MERKIGEKFEIKGQKFEVIEGNCNDCYFQHTNCLSSDYIDVGICAFRNDGKSVCAKLVK